MINFEYDGMPYRYFTDEELAAARESLEEQKLLIRIAKNRVGSTKIALGEQLISLYKSKDYASDPGWIVPKPSLDGKKRGCLGPFTFFSFCEKNFDLDKSQVSRYMNIADEFGNGKGGLKGEWKEYSYSQLAEILPLTPEQRRDITPQMTIAMIRAYKQRLVAMSQQEEEKPKKSVATSQPKDYYIKSTDFPTPDNKYIRFYGCSVRYVCNQVLKAEEEIAQLRQLLEDRESIAATVLAEHATQNQSEVTG